MKANQKIIVKKEEFNCSYLQLIEKLGINERIHNCS